MTNDKLRRQIAYEAARLMVVQRESEFHRAKQLAARRLGHAWLKPDQLPTNQEIRDEIIALSRMTGGEPLATVGHDGDRFAVYRRLLLPLETVQQNPARHPEGDALYHSLQVFRLAWQEISYDEEFQLAALLHDVGKAIDPREHVPAALEALNGHITPRTAWFIEHHSAAGALAEGTLGMRARRRLEASPDFDDLMLLCRCDRRGREVGVQVPDVDEALAMIRELSLEG